ncbi:MAG: DNA topoisomerase III, partial [Oscillospiraceae bacterium]|nr:DNA topoisomerase III [Oscillospiraceae bacterium]
SGKRVLEPGWKAAYDRSFSAMEDEGDEAEEQQRLPELQKGQRLKVRKLRLSSGKTTPPARYTEATLLTAMEHPQGQVADRELQKILQETSGLGTPATRADIIEKLFSSFYIERQGKSLVPTSKGIQLVGLAPAELRSAELTARWEDRLARIAKGQEQDADFVAQMRQYAAKLVKDVRASEASYTHDNQTRKPCPQCGKLLLLVKDKRGELLVCPDRDCGFRKRTTQLTNARCPNCHKKLELWGEGDKQTFACACGYREKLSDFETRRKRDGAGKSDVRRYMAQQGQKNDSNPAMADALAKWLAQRKE